MATGNGIPTVHTTGVNWLAVVTTTTSCALGVAAVVGVIMRVLVRFIGRQIDEKITPLFIDMQKRVSFIEGQLTALHSKIGDKL